MPTYSDEVNIYNTDAIAQDIQRAENAHKAYITEVSADNGIVVAARGKGTVDGAIGDTTTGWHLADVLEFIKQGVSRFWIGLKNQTDSTPTVRIGKEYKSGATDNESHMELDYHSMQLKDRENYTYFHVSDLREKLSNGTYAAALTDIFVGDGSTTEFDTRLPMLASNAVLGVWVDDVSISAFRQQDTDTVKVQTAPAEGVKVEIQYLTSSRFAKAYTFGIRKGPDTGSSDQQIIGAFSVAEGMACEAAGAYSHAEGVSTHAIAYVSHAEGEKTTASGMDSHAEGSYSEASGGGSHAEGWHTSASGVQAHAEGEWTVASGIDSHAEGAYTEATDDMSHAEGFETEASGYASHAEGEGTHATGTRSHAQNNGTRAQYADQTVIGRSNDNQSDNAFEIGNGTGSVRSNAFAVDWNGNVEAAGKVNGHSALKTLWSGTWSSGTLKVAGISDYKMLEITFASEGTHAQCFVTGSGTNGYVRGSNSYCTADTITDYIVGLDLNMDTDTLTWKACKKRPMTISSKAVGTISNLTVTSIIGIL